MKVLEMLTQPEQGETQCIPLFTLLHLIIDKKSVCALLKAKVRANVYATTFVRTLYVIMSKGIIDYFFNLP